MYDQLLIELPALRSRVEVFSLAGGEENVPEQMFDLHAEVNRLAPMDRLWLRDVQELQNMQEGVMFAEQMEYGAQAQAVRGEQRRNAEEILRSSYVQR